MNVLISRVELHLPLCQSLKAKRSVLVPIVVHLDQMAGVGAAEIEHQDLWQRATIGISVVGAPVSHQNQVMESIERYLWSRSDVDIIEITESWWEED